MSCELILIRHLINGMGIDFKMVLLLKLTKIDSGNRLE